MDRRGTAFGTTSMTAVLDAFLQVRGEESDQVWAEQAAATMVMVAVDVDAIEEELERALELVRTSGEAPADLYGPASTWARARVRERGEEGLAVYAERAGIGWQDIPAFGLLGAAIASVLMLVASLFTLVLRMPFTLGHLALPLLGSFTVATAIAVHQHVLARRARAVAVTAAGAVLAVGVLATTAVVWSTRDHPIAAGNGAWLAAIAVVCALLGLRLARTVPHEQQRPEPRDDDAWAASLAGTLRSRLDLDERRVRDIVQEARSHAEAAGTSLAQEFGPPSGYAARFPQDRTAARRRDAWLQTALIPIAGVLAFGGLADRWAWSEISWWGVGIMVIAVLLTWRAWRRVGAATGD